MSKSMPVFLDKLRSSWPPEDWREVTVLVAVSGGADSVALARGLAQLRTGGAGRLVLAHFNHRLRGAESAADEAFVLALAQSLNCPAVVGRAEGEARLTSEAAARNARYAFLKAAGDQWGARFIATAHTADDQVETVLHNILRGAGMAGLAGMPRTRTVEAAASIIRPLLGATRAEVLAYLQLIGQSFREDSSNAGDAYTRNRIRRHLLPLLEREYNPQVREALRRLSRIAEQTDDYLDEVASYHLAIAVKLMPQGVEIERAALAGVHRVVVRQLFAMIWRLQQWPLQDMSWEKWDGLATMLQSDKNDAAVMLPGSVLAKPGPGVLQLTRDLRTDV